MALLIGSTYGISFELIIQIQNSDLRLHKRISPQEGIMIIKIISFPLLSSNVTYGW